MYSNHTLTNMQIVSKCVGKCVSIEERLNEFNGRGLKLLWFARNMFMVLNSSIISWLDLRRETLSKGTSEERLFWQFLRKEIPLNRFGAATSPKENRATRVVFIFIYEKVKLVSATTEQSQSLDFTISISEGRARFMPN